MKKNHTKHSFIIYSFIVIVSIFLFNACKSKEQIVRGDTTNPKKESVKQAIQRIQNAEPDFTTANVNKMSANVTVGSRQMKVSASFKYIKDSVMVLAVQPFMGIELFRAEFYPEHFYIFDKLNQRYVEERYKYFSDRFGIDIKFENIQALISNRLFCVGETEMQPKKCSLVTIDDRLKSILYESDTMLQNTIITSDNTVKGVTIGTKNSAAELNAGYDDFSIINKIYFPRNILLEVNNANMDIIFDFTIDKVTFNQEMKMSYTNIDKYKRITFSQLLNK